MNVLLMEVQQVEPSLKSLSVTRLQSKVYHAVIQILKNHTNNRQFFLQFFKYVDKCDSRACGLDLRKPRLLPAPIFEAVHTSLHMPLPTPQPQPEAAALGLKEFYYMTL
eukprot:jgi/Tetstr1/420673/TSEL_011760.t1